MADHRDISDLPGLRSRHAWPPSRIRWTRWRLPRGRPNDLPDLHLPEQLGRRALEAALELGLEAQDGLGVKLRDARLRDAEDLADRAQRELVVVVEGDDRLFAVGQLADRPGQRLAHLRARHLRGRIIRVRVLERVD